MLVSAAIELRVDVTFLLLSPCTAFMPGSYDLTKAVVLTISLSCDFLGERLIVVAPIFGDFDEFSLDA